MLSRSWPTQTIGASGVTDSNGNTIGITTGTNGVTAVTQPAGSGDNTAITYDGTGKVSTITKGGTTSTYSYSDSGGTRTTTVTSPGSTTETYVTDITSTRLMSKTDQTGRTSTYLYDAAGRRTRETLPEGNYTNWTYDARGNVTETRIVAKPASGTADILTTANYDVTCSNPLTCNQPNFTIDANGNRTDYTYSATRGGVTELKLPAPALGQPRPEIDYTYTALYAQSKDATGTVVSSSTAEYKPTLITICATASACGGSANETRITFAYNTPKLLPTSKTVAAGDGSIEATTTYTYDEFDNIAAVDGPLPGALDTTYYFYDALHNMTGSISPDPDGGGSLQRRAVRKAYDVQSRLIKVEIGTVAGTTLADLSGMAVLQQLDTVFDGNGNKVRDMVSAGGTAYQVAQYSYDAMNRLECTALRMNPAVFASLPSSACSLGASGSAGPDRISRTSYDAADRPIKIQTAYGTADQADEASSTYTVNGKLSTLTDANGNKTSYGYDGFDRLTHTVYPVYTPGQNTSNGGDYEQLVYDANGNVISRRLRDGRAIAFTYDALNRVVLKDLPGGSGSDVYYAYDLQGRLLSARYAVPTGEGINLSWDAMGRLATQITNLGGFARTLSYGYDVAGNRTRVTHPDGVAFTNVYDGLNRYYFTYLGSYPAIDIVFDAAGRKIVRYLGLSSQTVFGWDGLSRLTSQTIDLAGTAQDVQTSLAYNAASQVVTKTRDNDAYAFNGYVNVDRAYTVNGLDQYTSAGPAAFTYDANGNLTSDGSTTYSYDAENRLVLATGAHYVTLAYDPLGRLFQTWSPTNGTTQFLYDGDQLTAEYDGSGNLLRRYVHGPDDDDPLIWYEGPTVASPRYLYSDHQGSIVAVADAAGNRIAANTYDEYGIPGSGNIGRFQYTGQAWIPELGMYYYKARMYSPTLGRFLQTDPIGYGDGLNWYNYVGSDPINATDPSGLNSAISAADVSKARALGFKGTTVGDFYQFLAAQELSLNGFRATIVVVGNSNSGSSNSSNPGYSAPVNQPFGSTLGSATGGTTPQKTQPENACAVAANEPGAIAASGASGTLADGLGLAGGVGKFKNVQTGTSGYYVTVGVAGGADVSASYGGSVTKNMSTFLGFSLSVTGSLPGRSGTVSVNGSGSGVGVGTAVGAGVATTVTYTRIFGCKVGGK